MVVWEYHCEIGGIPLAAISATKIFVSARMTSRPGPAKTMLADVIPRKIFPSKVPSSFQTYRHASNEKNGNVGQIETDLHPIPTTRVHVALEINLDTVRDARINVGENSTVLEGMCPRINIEGISRKVPHVTRVLNLTVHKLTN